MMKKNLVSILLGALFALGCSRTDRTLEWNIYSGKSQGYDVRIDESFTEKRGWFKMIHLYATNENIKPMGVTGHYLGPSLTPFCLLVRGNEIDSYKTLEPRPEHYIELLSKARSEVYNIGNRTEHWTKPKD